MLLLYQVQSNLKRPLKELKHCALLQAKIFTLGEWYSCRGLELVANTVECQLWGLRWVISCHG